VRRHLDAIPGTVPSLGAMPAGCRFHPRCAYAVDACRTDPVQLLPHGAGHETRCLRHDALELRGVPEPDPEPAGELVPELLR
jgi:ABC-type dipeptide/oligopeptide/nickel transport system ATPase component